MAFTDLIAPTIHGGENTLEDHLSDILDNLTDLVGRSENVVCSQNKASEGLDLHTEGSGHCWGYKNALDENGLLFDETYNYHQRLFVVEGLINEAGDLIPDAANEDLIGNTVGYDQDGQGSNSVGVHYDHCVYFSGLFFSAEGSIISESGYGYDQNYMEGIELYIKHSGISTLTGPFRVYVDTKGVLRITKGTEGDAIDFDVNLGVHFGPKMR